MPGDGDIPIAQLCEWILGAGYKGGFDGKEDRFIAGAGVTWSQGPWSATGTANYVGSRMLRDLLRLPSLPRRVECCDISHLGGGDTVGVRVPAHEVTRALCRAARRPLTATSANPSGEPPTDDPDVVASVDDPDGPHRPDEFVDASCGEPFGKSVMNAASFPIGVGAEAYATSGVLLSVSATVSAVPARSALPSRLSSALTPQPALLIALTMSPMLPKLSPIQTPFKVRLSLSLMLAIVYGLSKKLLMKLKAVFYS